MTARTRSVLGVSALLLVAVLAGMAQRKPGHTITSSLGAIGQALLFAPDNTWDIGASAANRPKNVNVAGTVFAPAYDVGVKLLFNSTAPTISAGFGTSPAIQSSNGSATFRVDVGTGGAATTGTVGLPAATTGWNCLVIDTHAATPQVTRQTSSTTTTSVWTAAAAWTASTILLAQCEAF